MFKNQLNSFNHDLSHPKANHICLPESDALSEWEDNYVKVCQNLAKEDPTGCSGGMKTDLGLAACRNIPVIVNRGTSTDFWRMKTFRHNQSSTSPHWNVEVVDQNDQRITRALPDDDMERFWSQTLTTASTA